MALTDAQKVTLKAHILANPDAIVIAALTDGSHAVLAEWYSSAASPAFIVWKSHLDTNSIVDSTAFSGAGGFIARTAGEREAYALLVSRGSINPSLATIRQKFSDIFSGSGVGAPETRTALLALSKLSALNVEKVFATGTGTDASPATLVYEGPVYVSDIGDALATV